MAEIGFPSIQYHPLASKALEQIGQFEPVSPIAFFMKGVEGGMDMAQKQQQLNNEARKWDWEKAKYSKEQTDKTNTSTRNIAKNWNIVPEGTAGAKQIPDANGKMIWVTPYIKPPVEQVTTSSSNTTSPAEDAPTAIKRATDYFTSKKRLVAKDVGAKEGLDAASFFYDKYANTGFQDPDKLVQNIQQIQSAVKGKGWFGGDLSYNDASKLLVDKNGNPTIDEQTYNNALKVNVNALDEAMKVGTPKKAKTSSTTRTTTRKPKADVQDNTDEVE